MYDGFFAALGDRLQQALVNYHYQRGGAIHVVNNVHALGARLSPGNEGFAVVSSCRAETVAQPECAPLTIATPRSAFGGEMSREGAQRNYYHELMHQVMDAMATRYAGSKDLYREFEDTFRREILALPPERRPQDRGGNTPRPDATGGIGDAEWRRAATETFCEVGSALLYDLANGTNTAAAFDPLIQSFDIVLMALAEFEERYGTDTPPARRVLPARPAPAPPP